jgi:predicted transposase YbfD/YdcC
LLVDLLATLACRSSGRSSLCTVHRGNNHSLHDGIAEFFDEQLENDFANVKVSRHETNERGHGREETRHCFVCSVPHDLPDAARWSKLKAIGVAISDTMRGGTSCSHVRYYILSRKLSGRKFAAAVRGHWSIENRLHWQLDVTFQEDQSRVRRGHADANCSLLRRTALSLLKNNHTEKVGVKNKRLCAAWNDNYLLELLCGP